MENYEMMFNAYRNGLMGKAEWLEYCNILHLHILWQHRELFVRMKYV